MRSPQIGFPQLVQDFFLRRLIAQRGASARTVEAYRDAFELLLGFAEQRTGKPPSALSLADLDAPLVLDFLDQKRRLIVFRGVGQGALSTAERNAVGIQDAVRKIVAEIPR